MKSGTHEEQLAFETKDRDIFDIPDPKTKLNTLQGYFFPRMDRLLKRLIERIRVVYQVDPLEELTFTYRPAHRPDAKTVKDLGEVYVGLTPKRTTTPIQVFHEDGKPYFFAPSQLLLVVDPLGALQASFRPYYYKVDQAFRERFNACVQANWGLLEPVLEFAHVAAETEVSWTPLRSSLVSNGDWNAPLFPFPLADDHWLPRIEYEFLALFPMLDTGLQLARGRNDRLALLIPRFKAAIETEFAQSDDEDNQSHAEDEIKQDLPFLENYNLVRPGLRYEVMMRDGYGCCLCGRSGKDGFLLEVDHIVPRSKGGANDISNLQTLCKKCNIGKSNKDDTRLTSAG